MQLVALQALIVTARRVCNCECWCSNLTMKACRKLLEEDHGLPDRALTDRKELIQNYVDKVSLLAWNYAHMSSVQADFQLCLSALPVL